MKKKYLGWKILGGIIVIPGLIFLAIWVFVWIWRGVMPEIFKSLPEISFWQAAGLLVMAHLLFGNLSTGSKKCKCRCKRKGGKKWRQMKEQCKKEQLDNHHAEIDGEASTKTADVEPS